MINLTFFTKTKKIYSMSGYFKRTQPFGLFINIRILRHLEINDCTAFFTNKMVMWSNLGFKTVERAAKRQFLNMTLRNKNM